MSNDFDWKRPGIREQLEALWLDPQRISGSEIGRRMGVSKNAVAGAVCRFGLPPRASPIIEGMDAAERQRRRRERERQRRALQRAGMPSMERAVASRKPPPTPPKQVAPAKPKEAPRQVYERIGECCFPIGDPGTRSFRYCDDPTAPNRPYCAKHAAICYVRVRDRRDDVAQAA